MGRKEPKPPGGQVVLGIVVLAIHIIYWLGRVDMSHYGCWNYLLNHLNAPNVTISVFIVWFLFNSTKYPVMLCYKVQVQLLFQVDKV